MGRLFEILLQIVQPAQQKRDRLFVSTLPADVWTSSTIENPVDLQMTKRTQPDDTGC
jgi:hypothetical protein